MQVTQLLSDEVLNGLSPADKLVAIRRLITSLSDQSEDPEAWYSSLPRYVSADRVDWGSSLSSDSHQASPTPPDDHNATLTGIVDNLAHIQRAFDNTMVAVTTMANRAVSYDADAVLGVPKNITMWRSGHGFIADRFNIETQHAAVYKHRVELIGTTLATVDQAAIPPLLPKLAAAYRDGEVPSQNVDNISRAVKTIKKYLREVGLTAHEAQDIIAELDEPFTNAAVSVKPGALSKMTDDMLAQVAAIVDPDGPAPAELLNTVENYLEFREVNGKLKVEMLTDVVNLEMFMAIFYAGLNYRAQRNRYHSDPEQAQAAVDESLAAAVGTAQDQPGDQSFLADVDQDLPEDATEAQRVAAVKEKLQREIDEAAVHAETMEGDTPKASDMQRLDRRSRTQRQHDVFVNFLRATGRLDPSIHGLRLFGGAATQLRIAMDYQTFSDQLGTRLSPEFHLDQPFRRPEGMAGFDTGASPKLNSQQFAPEQCITLPNDDESTLIELQTNDGRLRIPKPRRGHPFISRGLISGTIAPQQLRAQLCDAQIIPQILGSGGVVLDKGRAKRNFPNHVKEDLALRGACSIPNCRSPVAHTDGHHLIWWSHGGATDIENLALVCSSCHTLVHESVWTPVFDANGELYWKPAAWLDPYQIPLRNTYWD